jgi:DNA-binding protein YbaB
VAVTADHRAEVDELLADYRRSREQLASVHHRLSAVSESVTSHDGLVTATVGADGVLTGLAIADAAYRIKPADLAALIVATASAAASAAAKVAGDVLAPVLPADTDPAALLRGTADLTAAELVPPVPAAAEESFENQTYLEKR